MSYLSTDYRLDIDDQTPLLGSGPDAHSEHQGKGESSGLASQESSPTLASREEHGPSTSRTLKLELGPLTSKAGGGSDLYLYLLEARNDVKQKTDAYHKLKLHYDKTMDKINSLARQYNEQQRRKPTNPPKGTWFQEERRLLPQRKAAHEECLAHIFRTRQAVIDRDLPKVMEPLRKAYEAVTEAKKVFDELCREMKLSEA